jgi:hypothetical protein
MKVGIVSESIEQAVEGVVSVVGEVTTDADKSGQPGVSYVPVTISPSKTLASSWNGLDVRLTITSAQTSGEVLVVPLSAVSAAADGKTTVTVVERSGKQTRVEVRAGVSGDGFVEVEAVAGDLQPGDQVVVSQ